MTTMTGRNSVFFAALFLLATFSASLVQAGTINLIKPPGITPDITTSYYHISYDKDTHEFSAYATSYGALVDNTHYLLLGDGSDGTTPVFSINMNIDPDTGAPVSGSLNIAGHFDDGSGYNYLGLSTDQTLLTGNINQFGFGGATSALEFVFNVAGGGLQTAGAYPSQVGILFHQSGFTGDWHTSFSNDGVGVSDLFPVPEPVSGIMLLVLIPGVVLVYRRRNRVHI
jgi:hypothetical protein